MKIRASYDIIIVGAGISGLVVARELSKKYPKLSIALCERYKGFGGRTYSYWPEQFPGVHWEMGAGRVHKSHKRVLGLLKEYGLHWVPIGSGLSYRTPGAENPFEGAVLPVRIAPLKQLSGDVLAKYTLNTICEKVYGKQETENIFAPFPYRAEVNVLRADLALQSFLQGEMSGHEGYGVVAEGFSELIVCLKDECARRGVTLLPRHRLLDFKSLVDGSTDCEFEFESGKTLTLKAEKACVLALHSMALRELPSLKAWSPLRFVKSAPLFRIYMIFPKPAWFAGIGRIVFDELPRYMIPIDEVSGVVMISYTDNEDTRVYENVYKERGEKALQDRVMRDVRKVFPGLTIPDPVFMRPHFWELGASYWVPGEYEPEDVSRESLRFGETNVFVAGETFSLRQAWVEGALEQTENVLKVIKNINLE